MGAVYLAAMRSPRTAVAFALVLGSLLAPAADAARPLKAPSGVAFYTPPRTLTGKHGDVIWSRTVRSSLTKAQRTTLVLYRSTAPDGKAIAVSGTVTIPKGDPPPGGWPVISWAHGTTGIADRCAPTRQSGDRASSYIFTQLNTWLGKGYALARTDYEGLGTPGTHPFLIGRSEGRGVVDIVRAARKLNSDIGKRYVIAGHSQGGHAALWAASLAPSWASELRLRGVIPFAPASQIGTQARAIGVFDKPSPISGLAALIFAGARTASSAINEQAIISDKALPFVPQVDTKCLSALAAADSFGGIAPKELLREGADLAPLLAVLDANNPDLRITVPVLMLQGGNDSTVFSTFTDELNKQLKAQGDTVDYRIIPGIDHGGIVKAGFPAANRFLKQRLGR